MVLNLSIGQGETEQSLLRMAQYYAAVGTGESPIRGVTTSHGRDHDELETALKAERFDFVQLSYNVLDRAVEQRVAIVPTGEASQDGKPSVSAAPAARNLERTMW